MQYYSVNHFLPIVSGIVYFHAVLILCCYLSDTVCVIKAYTFVSLLSQVHKNGRNWQKICYVANIKGCCTNGRKYRILLQIYHQCWNIGTSTGYVVDELLNDFMEIIRFAHKSLGHVRTSDRIFLMLWNFMIVWAVHIDCLAFWDMTLCSLIDSYQSLRGTCCVRLCWRWKQQVSLKHWY